LSQVVQHGFQLDERTLGVMPLYHTMGVHSMIAVSLMGGCFVAQPEWDAETALRLIERERITSLYLAPTLFYDLVHHARLGDFDTSSVRAVAYAGAPMTSALAEKVAEAFDPEIFVNHYGSTEIYTFSVHRDQRAKPGCAGRAALNARIRLDPPGEGEILCHMSSDEAFAGYWNRPDADAKAIRDSWYHTGDVGRIDEDGDLWVVGRVDDMVISGGENIHPVEVEDVLARAPGVREVAVIAAADDRLDSESSPHRRRRGSDSRAARRVLPRLRSACPLQAATRVPLRLRAPEEPVWEDPPAIAARRSGGAGVSEYDGFRVERDDVRAIATITLDVPGKLNRVSMLARDQLRSVFEELDRDDDVRFVVLAGAGESFTAGGDIAGFLQKSAWDVSRLADNVAAPERCTKPVLAALQGHVLGVGLELALACDFRLAADDVQLGFPEVTIGMIPGSGGTQRLARLIGLGRAKDVIMRGRRIDAEEALALGLVTEVVPAGELDAVVARLIDELARHSPLALAMAKRVLNQAYDGPLRTGLELEGLAYGLLQQTHDFREGVEAFGEKRKPEFRGD
jgi:2-oxoglutaroyl-CoA hydrolase